MTPSEPRGNVSLRSVLTDPLVGPIVALVFILLAGLGLALPIIPLFARSFGVDYGGTGVMIGAFGFGRLFGDLIGGSIVDRRGERWSAVLGMAGLAVCATATALAPNFAVAVLLWGLSGVWSAINFAALFSFILKAAPAGSTGRTLSFFFGAFNIGVIVGGAIGGNVADAFGLKSPLFAYSGILVLSILFYLRFVPDLPARSTDPGVAAEAGLIETSTVPSPIPSKRFVREFLRVPGFSAALVLNLAYLWVVAAVFNTLLALYAKDHLGMSTTGIGAVYAVAVAAEFVVLFPAGSWADRYGRKAVLVPSMLALSATIAVLGWASTPVLLGGMLALVAFASGFAGVPPAAMLSDVVPTENSGRAVGAFRFCGDIGFFLGPLVAGAVGDAYGFKAAFAVSAIPPFLAFLMMLRVAETLKKTESR
ncbi:MAG: transporter, family, multidrug resistance protein [Actinomycetota bacterium]|jgi:MFS family permease|nr:transporter, family, multidrug resistance protein [Actinomycetota bacterium]